jgi:hypothetical protein
MVRLPITRSFLDVAWETLWFLIHSTVCADDTKSKGTGSRSGALESWQSHVLGSGTEASSEPRRRS